MVCLCSTQVMVLFHLSLTLLFTISHAIQCNNDTVGDSDLLPKYNPKNCDNTSMTTTCVGIQVGLPGEEGFAQQFTCDQAIVYLCFGSRRRKCVNKFIRSKKDGKWRMAVVCCCGNDFCNTDAMFPKNGTKCYAKKMIPTYPLTKTICVQGKMCHSSEGIQWTGKEINFGGVTRFMVNKQESHGCQSYCDRFHIYLPGKCKDNEYTEAPTNNITRKMVTCCCEGDLCNTQIVPKKFKCNVGTDGDVPLDKVGQVQEVMCSSNSCFGFNANNTNQTDWQSYHCGIHEVLKMETYIHHDPCLKYHIKPGQCKDGKKFKGIQGRICCCNTSLCNVKEMFEWTTKRPIRTNGKTTTSTTAKVTTSATAVVTTTKMPGRAVRMGINTIATVMTFGLVIYDNIMKI